MRMPQNNGLSDSLDDLRSKAEESETMATMFFE